MREQTTGERGVWRDLEALLSLGILICLALGGLAGILIAQVAGWGECP